MRVLLIYPLFPKTFWSYEKILELVNRKVLLPPLGLITVAAILPQEWNYKLVDRNVRSITEAPNLQRACQNLVTAANLAGGPDNISVVLAQLIG